MSLHDLSRKAIDQAARRDGGGKIVFVSGNFNIIHPGHLRLLRFAKECGDYLLVGVHKAGSPGAIIPEELRLEAIHALSGVDQAFLLHDSPEEFIRELRPSFVAKGKEHEEHFNPEAEVLAETGGTLLFGSGDIGFSSFDLIRHELVNINPSVILKPSDYPARHRFSMNDIASLLKSLKGLRVCVIGDTIIDEFITCDPIGLSQEDPTIVVKPILTEKFIGGAAIVAAHAHGLGATTHFFTVLGDDDAAPFVHRTMGHEGSTCHFYVDENRPTTLKQRFCAGNKTLLRVSHLRQHAITSDLRKKILDDLISVLDEIDLLVFADYSYGCLPQPLVDRIVEECRTRGIKMVADSQSSSQVGDVSRFHHMLLVTPTEREARLAVNDFDSGLVVLAEKLRAKAYSRNIVITLGSEGILIHPPNQEEDSLQTDRLPAFNTMPKNVMGAGDSFLACASMALAVGADIWQSAYLGSLAAGCQVGRLGNIPLSTEELLRETVF